MRVEVSDGREDGPEEGPRCPDDRLRTPSDVPTPDGRLESREEKESVRRCVVVSESSGRVTGRRGGCGWFTCGGEVVTRTV